MKVALRLPRRLPGKCWRWLSHFGVLEWLFRLWRPKSADPALSSKAYALKSVEDTAFRQQNIVWIRLSGPDGTMAYEDFVAVVNALRPRKNAIVSAANVATQSLDLFEAVVLKWADIAEEFSTK